MLFEEPSVVLIGGTWKVGKTDFGLYISEWLKRIKSWTPGPSNITIISEVATNIDTFGAYPQITDLISIKQWLYGSKRRKLYICDEASEHFKNRRSMSNKNVGFMDLIPQISKAHGRMIVIGHNLLKVDSELLEETWCRGVFLKETLKSAHLLSNRVPGDLTFENLSRTSIKFDPYDIAPLTERPQGIAYFKDADKELVWKWANGATYKTLGLAPMQLHRKLKKFVLSVLESDLNTKHT